MYVAATKGHPNPVGRWLAAAVFFAFQFRRGDSRIARFLFCLSWFRGNPHLCVSPISASPKFTLSWRFRTMFLVAPRPHTPRSLFEKRDAKTFWEDYVQTHSHVFFCLLIFCNTIRVRTNPFPRFLLLAYLFQYNKGTYKPIPTFSFASFSFSKEKEVREIFTGYTLFCCKIYIEGI